MKKLALHALMAFFFGWEMVTAHACMQVVRWTPWLQWNALLMVATGLVGVGVTLWLDAELDKRENVKLQRNTRCLKKRQWKIPE